MSEGYSGKSLDGIDSEARRQFRELGLDVATLAVHRERVRQFLTAANSRFFPILDTCRLDNGGIFRLPAGDSSTFPEIPVVAFVPAAGASSRYLAPMTPLMDALRSRKVSRCAEAMERLSAEGVLECPVPSSVHELLAVIENSAKSGVETIESGVADRVIAEIEAPKALYPAVHGGTTFLEMKRIEHEALGLLAGEVYVCPPGRGDEFSRQLRSRKQAFPARCYDQDASLGTTRFDGNANVALDGEGRVSMVPAGHGSLLALLPRVAVDFPGSRGVFIRNIDNVAGTSDVATSATRSFIRAFQRTLRLMDDLRRAVDRDDAALSRQLAGEMLRFWKSDADSAEDPTRTLMERLFFSGRDAGPMTRERLRVLLRRPLVLMGQVPNTARDVGGTCVFADVNGIRQKLCLEVPHASPEDKARFLEDPAKATHFNPVFVAAEIPDRDLLSSWGDHPFWLVAKKSWRGQDTYYQESILYEMLGSSEYANVLFVEVPRAVFNPHKTLKDAGRKTLKDWVSV